MVTNYTSGPQETPSGTWELKYFCPWNTAENVICELVASLSSQIKSKLICLGQTGVFLLVMKPPLFKPE